MSVTSQLLEANSDYAAGFDKGHLPMPPGKHVAVVACMDAFGDVEADVKQSIARLQASRYLVDKSHIRGFVYDVTTGALAEVS